MFIIEHEVAFAKGHYGDYNHVITERDKNDPGGTTRFGIDFGEHRSRPWNLTEDMIDKLTLDQAKQIYWKHYCFDRIEMMPPKTGECVFNCATMSGLSQAMKILSRQNSPEAFLKDECHVFDLIAQHRPASGEYVVGWKNRCVDLAKFLELPNPLT